MFYSRFYIVNIETLSMQRVTKNHVWSGTLIECNGILYVCLCIILVIYDRPARSLLYLSISVFCNVFSQIA